MDKKYFSCKARQARDVVVYVEAADEDEAHKKLSNGEWDEYDAADEDDDSEGIVEFDLASVAEVSVDDVDPGDEDEDDE